jgi:UDP-glucose 4-epimerase
MNSVLVTGCAGLIGSTLAKAFLQQGHRVIGIDNMSGGMWSNLPPMPDPMFSFFQTDLTNYSDMREIFMSQRPRVVYHLASCPREGSSEFQPVKITASNIMASITVLELGLRYGMERLVFTSSMSVYGKQDPPFSEKMSRQPVDPYGVNKAATEQIIEQMAETHGFEWVILRPHNVFGQGASIDPYRGVVTIFMNRIMRQEPIYLYGENHVRAFSYMEDCLPAMMKAADSKKANHKVINVGGISPTSVKDLAEVIINCFPEYPRPEIIQLPPRPHEVAKAWCTTDESIKILDYKEEIGWEEGIKRTAIWAKKLGPQPWVIDNLPLLSNKAPKPWLYLAGLPSD